MIHRKADKWIDDHFRNTKKALLLTGARQVGKTYAPIYRLMFIEKRKDEGPKIYKLDLGGLV